MNAIILYLHLAVVAVISAMFNEALKTEWLKVLFSFMEVSAVLVAYGYAIWSLVNMIIK